jgi:hypothetical protein
MSAALPLRRRPAGLPWQLLLVGLTAPLLLLPGWMPAATVGALLLLLVTSRRLPTTPLGIPLLLYLALSALSFIGSPYDGESLPRLLALFLGVQLFYRLARVVQAHPAYFYPALRMLGWGGALLSLGSLFAMEWPSRHLIDLSFLTTRLPHLSGPFTVNHNQIAGLLLLLLPLAAAGWLSAPTSRQRLIAGAASATILGILLLTQSRNAWLSIGVAAAGILLWRRRSFWPLLLLVLLLLLLPFLVTRAPRADAMSAFIDWLDTGSKAGPVADRSWLARVEMWQAAIQMMSDYPTLGAGLYSFDAASRANYVYQVLHPAFPISHAHNLFLQTGAGLGWAGWLGAALLWISLLFSLWQAHHNAPDRFRLLGQALAFSLLVSLSFNTFDLLALEQRAGLLLWLLFGLVSGYAVLWGPQPGRRQRLLQLSPLVMLLLLLPGLPHTLAHRQLDRIRLGQGDPQTLAPTQMGDARRQGLVYYLQGNQDLARIHWVQDSEAVPFLLNQGQQAYLQDRPREAVGWYDQALALERTATLYYWRGQAREALGQELRALADYRQVAALAAGERLYDVNLEALAWERQGRLLVARDEWEGARDAFARAVALAPEVVDYQHQFADVERMLAQLEAAR